MFALYKLIIPGLLLALPAHAESPQQLLERFDAYPHAQALKSSAAPVVDYEIGLGAMQKSRGAWRFKHSERQSGELQRYTWQIIDGFTSSEILQELESSLSPEELIFSCDGRSCGQGVQWANRVFQERLLYGRDDLQQYRVYGSDTDEGAYRLLFFSSSRTADRQYLHAEFLDIQP